MSRWFQVAPQTMAPVSALLLALLAACGGGGGGTAGAAPEAPAAVEVFVADESTGARRLLGMAEDGSASRVLVPDAGQVLFGRLVTYRTDLGLVYAVKGGGTSIREIRLVSLDGKTDRLLRSVDDSRFDTRMLGVRAGHLVVALRDSSFSGPLESLPLAGGAPVALSPRGEAIELGAGTLVYQQEAGAGSMEVRTAQVASGASQPFVLNGMLSRLASGGFLLGSYAGALVSPLSLRGNDFELIREWAPAGSAAWRLPSVQFPDTDPVEGGGQVVGRVPEGSGQRLMAYSRTGTPGVSLDASNLAGAAFHPIGLAGSRLAYRADQLDAAGEWTLSAYRSIPIGGGTPVELAPLAERSDEGLIGLTASCLVVASGKAPELSQVRFYPLEGGAPVEVYAWAPGGTSSTQAWIVGDRLVVVAFDGTTYRLTSVDAQGRNARVHLESAVAISGVNDNGTGVFQGRMCFTRGNDLLLLDPVATAPAVLHAGAARGRFVGWGKGRVLYSIQEPGTSGAPALWSARLDGGDARRLSPKAWLAEAR